MQRERDTVNLFSKLRFKIEQEKSRLFPSKEIEYLGFVINSENMAISLLSKNKAAKLLEILEVIRSLQKGITRRIEKLLSMFEIALQAVKHGQLFLWHFQNDKNRA